MSKERNNIGRYLTALRINAGFDNVSAFLKKYKLPLTGNYYRDIESGRKRLSLDMAVKLLGYKPFAELEEPEELIWYFLRDALPEELEKKLLLPRVNKGFKNSKDMLDLLRRDLKTYRDAAAIRNIEENLISPDDVSALLLENFDLLPILHHIYMAEETDERKISEICKAEGIKFDVERIRTVMAACSVEIKAKNGIYIFRRAKPTFRLAPTDHGAELKRRFLESELEKSKLKSQTSEIFDQVGTYTNSSIISVSSERAKILRERLQDYFAEITLAKDPIDKTDAGAYFVMCLISGRPEYNPKPK